MDVTRPFASHIGSASIAFLTSEEIKNVSVKQIVNPELLDTTNNPNVGGLYDPALGPMRRDDICMTCHQNSFSCPGHFGHIQLPSPVFHPLFMKQVFSLLRGMCLYCHHFNVPVIPMTLFIARLKLLDYGLVQEAADIALEAPRLLESASTVRGEDLMDMEAEEEGVADKASAGLSTESTFQFRKRIEGQVRSILTKAVKNGARRANDTTGAVYSARMTTVSQFTKFTAPAAGGKKKCPHCKAVSPTMRKDGHVKIVEMGLTDQAKLFNEAIGVVRPDPILLTSSPSDRKAKQSNRGTPAGNAFDEEKMKASKKASKNVNHNTRVMPPVECRANLRLLFENEPAICSLLFGRHGIADADTFFVDVLSVTPTRFRPAAVMGDQTIENAQNELLTKILRTCIEMSRLSGALGLLVAKEAVDVSAKERSQASDALMGALIQLQQDVNCFMDADKGPKVGNIVPTPGIKQLLEKKTGLFRQHMMGKRVNFAARSVISPDVNIETNEIGVPPVFAQKLTFNEPVTVHNIERMRRLVINGPNKYPGAVAIRNENGIETLLGRLTVEQRTALANQLLTPQEHTSRQSRGTFGGLGRTAATPPANKQVLRHLVDGDILILNRQPTLHKASMMAHRARVLKGERTIRMHYANCNSYNADFDGDEMNMHFPQSQAARAESYNICNTDNQYLIPTSGNPLRGLIQDHVIAGVWMTSKATLYTREEYQQMLYGALRPENDYSGNGRVITLPPAIYKPKPRWTGKQVISTVLLNIKPNNAEGLNLKSKSKVNGSLWGKGNEEEGTVLFRDGELLTGILDKAQFGASAYGLVHAVYEMYGPDMAGKLLSVLSRLFTKWLQVNAFTCRMDDLLLSEKGDAERREKLKAATKAGREAALQVVGLPKDSDDTHNLHIRLEEVLRDDGKAAALDSGMLGAARSLRTDVINEVLPKGQYRVFPENNFEMMVSSGAKGSLVNFSQISALLGAQELEGRRVPVMVSGKTLPSFKPFDTSLRAGGFVAGRFLTGIRPQEYYFHCMSGREGLIDTAVKTSRSGYLQRRLIKHLEGITVHYDNTVRNSDGTIIQFLYGEDGLDVTKSKYLDEMDFTAENFASFMRRYNPAQLGGVIDENEANSYAKKALKKPHKYAPATSVFNPARYLGSTSETFANKVQSYIDKNPNGLLEQKTKKSKGEKATEEGKKVVKIPSIRPKVQSDLFRLMNQVLYHRGLAEPGEGVGLVAAQSIGEPSTQMTLNTFHLAGHGAANVTLGIPRLNEIIIASQKIRTPIMKLPVMQGVEFARKKLFCKDGSRLLLSQVIENAIVHERISAKTMSTDFKRVKSYTIQLNFFPISECKEEYNVDVADILRGMEMTFAPILEEEILADLRRMDRDRKLQLESIGHGQRFSDAQTDAAAENQEDDTNEAESELKADKRSLGKKKRAEAKTRMGFAGDDSDEEEDESDDAAEGDTEESKRRRKAGAKQAYEDGDEESDSDDDEVPALDTEESIDAAFEGEGSGRKKKRSSAIAMDEDIESQVQELDAKLQDRSRYITSFQFDNKRHKWARLELQLPNSADKLLLINVVERACRSSVVHEVPKIDRILCPAEDAAKSDPNADPRLTAEGINLTGMWDFGHGIIDMDKIYTNDIGALLHTYGVEAARNAIVSEMRAIFDTYGINVSPRHLHLISDYQTFTGGYLPFSRSGMTDLSSPLQKASYETTMAFLSQAALFGEKDDMSSPSSNIVVGRPIRGGTGLPTLCTQIAA